jgi:hypothetical protein
MPFQLSQIGYQKTLDQKNVGDAFPNIPNFGGNLKHTVLGNNKYLSKRGRQIIPGFLEGILCFSFNQALFVCPFCLNVQAIKIEIKNFPGRAFTDHQRTVWNRIGSL